jgi:sigma-B regulation protein RsbU (phosphoserine phosphatase)
LENNSLVEKLALQVESFQEGFEILSKSFSLVEMVKNFLHIIRGNFIITEIYSFHKIKNIPNWSNISLKKIPDSSYLSYLKDSETPLIQYFPDEKIEVSIILPLADLSYLGILIGPKLDKSKFNDLDKITLQILLQVFDSAYKSFLNQRKEKALIFELNEKVLHLNNLIDTGIEISRYNKRSTLYEIALERVTSLTNAASSMIAIVKKSNNNQTKYITFPDGTDPDKILNSKFKIQSSFEHQDRLYNFILSEKETRHSTTAFTDLDKLLLDSISRQVSASLENEFLHKQALEKEKIEQELNVAASIQKMILPEKLPKINGYDLAGINIPSREVGGDYYDCYSLGNEKYAIIIADVAGKGIGAALLVSTLNAALNSYLQFDIPLTEISNRLNKLIYKSSPSDKYITFFIAVLDSNSGELDIVNAGHNPIFLLKKDGVLEKIDAGGVGLGMLDFGLPFEGQKTIMSPGDKLFLYTDGIPEAMNDKEEEYSDEEMINFLLTNSEKSSTDFIDLLVKSVKDFAGSAQQSDDITALLLKRN